MFQRALLYKYLIVLNISNWKHSTFWSKLRKILSGKNPECASYSSWRIYWLGCAIRCTCRMPFCHCKGYWLIQWVGSEKNPLQKRVFVLSILLLCCLSFSWGLATIFLDLLQAYEQAQAAQKFGSQCNTEVLLAGHANIGFQSPNMKYLGRTQIISLNLLCWKDISTMC